MMFHLIKWQLTSCLLCISTLKIFWSLKFDCLWLLIIKWMQFSNVRGTKSFLLCSFICNQREFERRKEIFFYFYMNRQNQSFDSFKIIIQNLQRFIGGISFQTELQMNQKKWNRIFIFFFIMLMPSSETYSWKICRQESLQNIWC